MKCLSCLVAGEALTYRDDTLLMCSYTNVHIPHTSFSRNTIIKAQNLKFVTFLKMCLVSDSRTSEYDTYDNAIVTSLRPSVADKSVKYHNSYSTCSTTDIIEQL